MIFSVIYLSVALGFVLAGRDHIALGMVVFHLLLVSVGATVLGWFDK